MVEGSKGHESQAPDYGLEVRNTMRFTGRILLLSAVAMVGCGGENDGAATTVDPAATTTRPSRSSDQAGPPAYAPISGKVREVKMTGDGLGYRFEPKSIRAKPGDGIKFVMHSFGPHNVVFDSAAIPADQRAQLYANMPNSEAGTSPLLFDEAEAWELSLGNLKPGRYPFFCSPHLGAKMAGEIIIE